MFTLEIETENDAFAELPELEMIRILNALSMRVKKDDSGPIIDNNGSKVGNWSWGEKPKRSKRRRLICCCRGQYTMGRQWHNQDKGYGVCPSCANEQALVEEPAYMVECYGHEKTHYFIS